MEFSYVNKLHLKIENGEIVLQRLIGSKKKVIKCNRKVHFRCYATVIWEMYKILNIITRLSHSREQLSIEIFEKQKLLNIIFDVNEISGKWFDALNFVFLLAPFQT